MPYFKFCSSYFPNTTNFINTLDEHSPSKSSFAEMPRKVAECTACGLVESKMVVLSHFWQAHVGYKDKQFVCFVCRKGFMKESEFNTHRTLTSHKANLIRQKIDTPCVKNHRPLTVKVGRGEGRDVRILDQEEAALFCIEGETSESSAESTGECAEADLLVTSDSEETVTKTPVTVVTSVSKAPAAVATSVTTAPDTVTTPVVTKAPDAGLENSEATPGIAASSRDSDSETAADSATEASDGGTSSSGSGSESDTVREHTPEPKSPAKRKRKTKKVFKSAEVLPTSESEMEDPGEAHWKRARPFSPIHLSDSITIHQRWNRLSR